MEKKNKIRRRKMLYNIEWNDSTEWTKILSDDRYDCFADNRLKIIPIFAVAAPNCFDRISRLLIQGILSTSKNGQKQQLKKQKQQQKKKKNCQSCHSSFLPYCFFLFFALFFLFFCPFFVIWTKTKVMTEG